MGYRFHPTDEEIVGDYVRPKNIESNTSRVDEVMNTVDIYEFDPWELPCKCVLTLLYTCIQSYIYIWLVSDSSDFSLTVVSRQVEDQLDR